MSLSPHQPEQDDKDFAEIEFRPQPVKKAPIPEKQEQEDKKEQVEETPAKEAAPEESTKEAPAKPEKKKSRAAAIVFDTLLILLLLAILAGGGYYIKQQMDLYRVPTPMELALQENNRLQQEHDALTAAFYRADEQLLMRQKLDQLDEELERQQAECSKLESSIEAHRNNVLAKQHEIRTTDKECRAIANSMLPGMAIGDAVTSRGKSLSDAYIYRLEGKLIVLRSHEGQIRIPIRELVKKDMPQMARYAFGEEDLIDMSDFDTNGEPPAKDKEKAKETQPSVSVREEPDYESRSGTPVVDMGVGSTIAAPMLPVQHNTPSVWDAPSGELPF